MSTPKDKPLCCLSAFSLPATAGEELMYMPAGVQYITPSQGGEAVSLQVLVDAQSAVNLERQRQQLVAKGRKPYFDFNHKFDAASFWPTQFHWKESPEPGVYARGEWSESGRKGIEGKEWRQFSPVFHVDDIAAKPARIVCMADADPNMGGLVNNPAFSQIAPFWARNAGGGPASHPTQIQANHTMTEEEKAALAAKIQALEAEVKKLKESGGDAAALKVKEDELAEAKKSLEASTATNTTLAAQNAELQKRLAALEATDKSRRDGDANAAVAAAVARGAIPAADEALKTRWTHLCASDASNIALLAGIQGNTALGGRITPAAGAVALAASHNGSGVVITAASGREILKAYGALVARNTSIRWSGETAKDKGELAAQAAEIYTADIASNRALMGMRIDQAIMGADYSEGNVGVLSGTLVIQKALDLFQFEYPAIANLTTDFADTPGLLNQTEMTRVTLKTAVQTFSNSVDSAGRPIGWGTVSAAKSVDVPLTLDEYVGVPIVFSNSTLASTMRNLFDEIAPQAMYSLGGYFMNKVTALCTPTNFNAYAATSVGTGATTNGSAAITVVATAGMYAGQAISGTGIPANTTVKSIDSGTAATLSAAATATNAGLTFTLNGGLVPTTYSSYAKALADFNLASLDDAAAAFDSNEVPQQFRNALLNAQYYRKLRQDPALNMFYAAQQSPEIITEGRLPKLVGFAPYNAPYFPTTSNRVGMLFHKAALVVKTRLPQDFTKVLSTGAPGTVTTVTNPHTGISVMLVQYVDLRSNYAEWRIEVMLGAAVGDRRGGLVLTSQ